MNVAQAWWKRRRDRAAMRAGIEPWWSRWAVTLAGASIVGLAFLDKQHYAVAATCGFFALLAGHYLLILLRKINYRLLELFTAALLAGTIIGLMLSMPGILTTPWIAGSLAFAVAAWVLHGLVKGLACSQLYNSHSSRLRMAFIVSAWVTSVAPALLAAAIILFLFSETSPYIPKTLRDWFIPFGIAGCCGILLKIALDWNLRKKALQVLSTSE